MTNHDKVIIAAQTTILIGNFRDFQVYVEGLLGRIVFSHELRASKIIWSEIKKKSKPDYKKLAERVLCRTVTDEELDSKELIIEIKEAVKPDLDPLDIKKIP